MTKDVVWFAEQSPKNIVEALLGFGLRLRNPSNEKINAFSSGGEEVSIRSEEEAIDFLFEGNGISFWIEPNHDLFVSFVGSQAMSASFDGFTVSEQAAFVARLRSAGLTFEVRHEDESPPDFCRANNVT